MVKKEPQAQAIPDGLLLIEEEMQDAVIKLMNSNEDENKNRLSETSYYLGKLRSQRDLINKIGSLTEKNYNCLIGVKINE